MKYIMQLVIIIVKQNSNGLKKKKEMSGNFRIDPKNRAILRLTQKNIYFSL